MGFLQRIAAAAGYQLTRSVDLNDPRVWDMSGGASVAGVNVTERAVLDLGLVESILANIGGPSSSIPLKLFEALPDGNSREAPDHPVYTVLHRRAGRRTAQEFREALAMDLAFRRECFAEIIPGDAGPVSDLDYIEPRRVMRVEQARDGRVYYRIAGRGTAPSFVLRDDEIWHTRRAPFSDDGLRGKPVWQTARETFGYALAIRRYGASWFRNSGRGGEILEQPTGSKFGTKEEEDAFLASWKASSNGANAHSVRLLKYGITRKVDQVTNNEAQFTEAAAAVAAEICGLWSMPLSKVGLLDKAIKASVEQQSLDFVTYCLGPVITALEQSAERDLLVGNEQRRLFIEHNVAGLLRGDIKTRYAAYFQGRQGGWLSVNDIRKLENMNGIGPEGDRYLEPENMRGAGERQTAEADPQDPEDDNG